MAYTPKQAGPTGLTTSAATIYTGATSPTITEVLVIVLANTSATVTITVEVSVASSTTVSAATSLLWDVPIPPNSTLILRGPLTLPSAQNVNGKASAAGVTMYVSVQEGS